ncbi:sialidase family protein [Lutibacter sp.]
MIKKIFFAIVTFMFVACFFSSCQKNEEVSWAAAKANVRIYNNIPSEFENPEPLVLNSEAWEDGAFITRDGLDLYCIYVPADLISFTNNGANQKNAHLYIRGNPLDMDITTNPENTKKWIHGDIYHSKRLSITDNFTVWEPVNIAIPVFNEGAPQGITLSNNDFDFFVYMKQNESAPYDNNIWFQKNVNRNLVSDGTIFPSQINSTYNEDNPHIERLSPNSLILFFERENHPQNLSSFNIWYTISVDNGATWLEAKNVSVINNFGDVTAEHIQPHLYFDSIINNWYLYFTTIAPDGKLGIYRSLKGASWDDWQLPELVLSSGNAIGIGEPTLSSNGDLYFVVVIENPNGTKYDKYDCDVWVVHKK